MYLLDTCIISEVASRKPNPSVTHWLSKQTPESLYLSVITIGEIVQGIQRMPPSQRRSNLEVWLNQDLLMRFELRMIDLDLMTMMCWGELTGRLEMQGRSLPPFDSLIAASALQRSFTLVTRNERDFAGTGVSILNPFVP